jgi:hypothetical protein
VQFYRRKKQPNVRENVMILPQLSPTLSVTLSLSLSLSLYVDDATWVLNDDATWVFKI